MLFVTLPFLLALWEYNLINIVERMSVEKKNAYIGVDLGGTNMRAGRIVGDRLVAQGSAPTPKDAADCEETLEALIEVIRSVWDESVVAIGIGVPSVVDREKGIVYNVVNIPHWEEVHLKGYPREAVVILTEKLKRSIRDLDMEHAFSAAQHYVSISQGICYDIPDEDRTMKNFLQKADDLLYQVKEENRGGICIGSCR